MKHVCLRLLASAGVAMLLCSPSIVGAATAPSLGMAQSFGVLGASTVTNTGPTVVNGDLGLSPGSSVTGFPPGLVNGTTHVTDMVASQAQTDATSAFNALGQACNFGPFGPTDLAGQVLVPGVYCYSSSVMNTGVLTLDAQGDSNAVWIFRAGSTLVTASGSSVVFSGLNGVFGQACNVFWQIGSSTTLGTSSQIVGTIIAAHDITLTTLATVEGRVLALGQSADGAVTMDSNTVTVSLCAAAATETPTETASETPTETPTATPSDTPTVSPSATASATSTASSTSTNTPSPTATFTDTATATASTTATPTNTLAPLVATETPTHTATMTPTATATITRTNSPTNTPTNSPSATPTVTPTVTPTPTGTATLLQTPTNTPTTTPTNTPTRTPTTTPTTTPTRTTTATFTVTRTRPPIPVVSSPVSPAGLLMIGGLSLGLLWALRRLGRVGA